MLGRAIAFPQRGYTIPASMHSKAAWACNRQRKILAAAVHQS